MIKKYILEGFPQRLFFIGPLIVMTQWTDNRYMLGRNYHLVKVSSFPIMFYSILRTYGFAGVRIGKYDGVRKIDRAPIRGGYISGLQIWSFQWER